MEKNFENKKEWNNGEWFDEKYKHIVDVLKAMPKNTLEQREERYHWVRNKKEYEQFVMDVFLAIDSYSYNKIKRRQESEYQVNDTLPPDLGIASTSTKSSNGKKNEIDADIFMDAVKTAVETFTGVNDDKEPITFLRAIGEIHRCKKMKAGGENDFQRDYGGMVFPVRRERLYIVLKLKRRVEKLCASLKKTNIEEVLYKCILEEKSFSKCTKEEIQLAKELIEGLNIVSFDKEVSDEENSGDGEGGETYKDKIKSEDSENTYKNIETQELLETFFHVTQNRFKETWKLIIEATGKQNRELIKSFLSKDILIALKLEALSEEMKDIYKELLEPNCGQWCPKKERCPYLKKENNFKKYKRGAIFEEEQAKTSPRRPGCFIRYGDREEIKDRGDRAIYFNLEQMGDSFYQSVLKNSYVEYAYIENVENAYDLFSKELKPAKGECKEECFRFTDEVLGNTLGKSKSAISKARAKYEQKARPMLYQLYSDESEGLL